MYSIINRILLNILIALFESVPIASTSCSFVAITCEKHSKQIIMRIRHFLLHILQSHIQWTSQVLHQSFPLLYCCFTYKPQQVVLFLFLFTFHFYFLQHIFQFLLVFHKTFRHAVHTDLMFIIVNYIFTLTYYPIFTAVVFLVFLIFEKKNT